MLDDPLKQTPLHLTSGRLSAIAELKLSEVYGKNYSQG